MPVSTFGYTVGGTLQVKVDRIEVIPFSEQASNQLGLALVRTDSNNLSPLLEGRYLQHTCFLNENIDLFNDKIGVAYFKLDFKNKKVHLQCNSNLQHLTLFHESNIPSNVRSKRASIDQSVSVEPVALKTDKKEITSVPPKVLADNHQTSGDDHAHDVKANNNNNNKEDAKIEPQPPKGQHQELDAPKQNSVPVSPKNPCSIDSLDLIKKDDGSYSFEVTFFIF